MNIASRYQLETVLGDPTRFAIAAPYVDATCANPVAIATNGRAMAIVPVDAQCTETGHVPVDALKAARKAFRRGQVMTFQVSGAPSIAVAAQRVPVDPDERPRTVTIETPGGTSTFVDERMHAQFPQWRNVLPDAGKVSLRIGINPSLLLNLAKAIGDADGVILEVIDPDNAIRVRPMTVAETDRDGVASGVIMPMRVPDDPRETVSETGEKRRRRR